MKQHNLAIANINLRDPYIYACPKRKKYYLFGTTKNGAKGIFEMYISDDLKTWSGPQIVFDLADHPTFWGKNGYWAPEVYYVDYLKLYIMFATVAVNNEKRSTVAFATPDLEGQHFSIYSDKITPSGNLTLDGTLYFIPPTGTPHIIYCREWLEIKDGTFTKARLSDDLKELDEESLEVMFRASEIPWATSPLFTESDYSYISDGPFFFRRNNVDFMLYSTFGNNGYQTGYCFSFDYWKSLKHVDIPLTEPNSGHAMVFTSFDKKDYIVYHRDNENKVVKPDIREIVVTLCPETKEPRLKLV